MKYKKPKLIRMKNLLLLLSICAFSINSFAQKGAFIGFSIMPQSAWILNNDDFDSGDFDFGIPFSVAFSFDAGYIFNESIGIQTGMLYSPQGQKYVDSDKNDLAEIKNNYLKIPLLFRLRSGGQKVAFLFNAGPQFGFLVGSSISSSVGDTGPPFGTDTRLYYESFEISAALGLGTSIAIGTNLQLDLMLKLDYGLSEIESSLGKAVLYDYDNDGRSSSNNALIGLNIGIKYMFGESDYNASPIQPID